MTEQDQGELHAVRAAYANFRGAVWHAIEHLRLDDDHTKLNEIRASLQDEFDSPVQLSLLTSDGRGDEE